MTAADQEQPEESSTFVAWLHEHHKGLTLDELDEALAEVIANVQDLGKVGTVQLTVKVAPQGRTMAITTDVKTKVPQPPVEADVFFPDREGGLHRSDPYQPSLPAGVVTIAFRDDEEPRRVETDTGEVREAGGDQ